MRNFLSRRAVPFSLALGLLIALAFAGTASALHPRPGGGTPTRVALVQAFAPCPGGPSNHVMTGAAAGFPSCPAIPESPILTTGAAGAGMGSVRLDTVCVPPPAAAIPPCTGAPGDQEDITFTVGMSDVSCGAAPPPPVAPFCTAGPGSDYAGPVLYQLPFRLTDHASGPPPGPPAPPPPPPAAPCAAGTGMGCTTATVMDFTFDIPVACGPVGPPAPPGSMCGPMTSSLDALSPGTVIEFQRMSFRTTDEIVATDTGPDGAIGAPGCPPMCGTGDEGVYRAAGQFAP